MKDIIIKKATDLFLQLGFKNITMDSLAKELAISKKTIYVHFKNKEELVVAGTDYMFAEISNGIDEISALNKNPIKELFVIKDFVMENLKNESTSPFYQLKKYYPQIYETLMSRKFAKMNNGILNNLENGIKQHFYRDDINLKLISRFYFSGIKSIQNAELFNPIQFSNLEVQQNFLEYHLRAICTPKGIDYLETIITTEKK